MTTDPSHDNRAVASLLRRVIREPLLGFAAAAFAIFGLNAVISDPEQETIVLSPQSVGLMIENREAMLGRQLNASEREEIIRTLADQEVLVREAVKMGLYMHDPKTRKRLIDQMHFLMAKKAPEPTGDDLDRLRTTYPERYMFPPTVSFRHVFFKDDKSAAIELAESLKQGNDVPVGTGDRFWLGETLEAYTDSQMLTLFGHKFVRDIRSLEPGVWSAPIRSARGWHVIRISEFGDSTPLPEQELRRRLLEDWQEEYRKTTYDTQLDEMRRHYLVEVAGAGRNEGQAVAELSLEH